MDTLICYVFFFSGHGRVPDTRWMFYYDPADADGDGPSRDVIEAYLWQNHLQLGTYHYCQIWELPAEMVDTFRADPRIHSVDITDEINELFQQFPRMY